LPGRVAIDDRKPLASVAIEIDEAPISLAAAIPADRSRKSLKTGRWCFVDIATAGGGSAFRLQRNNSF